MDTKHKLKIAVIVIWLVFVIGMIFFMLRREEDYTEKIIESFERTDRIVAQDIFLFEFKCAYILDDCYISGEGFAKKYNLDILINQVEAGSSENIQRIVFVNENNEYVYQYKCDVNDLIIEQTGIIIYPDTIIEKHSNASDNDAITVEFLSDVCYKNDLGD